MYFIVRDDDLNYFSAPADIERIYQVAFDLNIPVGLSTIPFIKKTSDAWFPREHCNEENKEYAIGDNKELVSYVKNNPLIEILQHGCTHETIDDVFEYNSSKNLVEKTLRGKKELEQVFNKTMRIFVAPHDTLSVQGIKAIEHCGMDIIRGRGTKIFRLHYRYILALAKMIWHKICHPRQKSMPPFPYVLDFGEHKEAYSCRLEDVTLSQLKKNIDFVFKKKGVFVLVNHIHYTNEEHLSNFKQALMYAREKGYQFIFPHQLFDGSL